MSEEETTTEEVIVATRERREGGAGPALVVQWMAGASEVSGGVLMASAKAAVFGRGEADGSGEARVGLVRRVPGENRALTVALPSWISRRQLRVQAVGDKVMVENLGRAALWHRGAAVKQVVLKVGERVTLGEPATGRFAALVARELTPVLAPLVSWSEPVMALGAADPVGLVGESAAMWGLRDRLAFLARQSGHVLVLGRSGSGKERVAQALHRLSGRAERPMVARNAATIPASLMDVELFGHVANFPNPGMRERPGLIGEADGGTLFLDEIGELSHELQAHLLRLMDSGEYQRLGDPKTRRVDVRVVAATNRARAELKADLMARFRHVIEVPSLSERPDDVTLLARHILRGAAREDALVAERFFEGEEPRLSWELVEGLLSHPLPMQVRDLMTLLWDAITHSVHAVGPDGGRCEVLMPGPALSDVWGSPREEGAELTAEELQRRLDEHGGNIERTAKALGMKNRYVLRRLIAKLGLKARAEG